MNTVKSKLLISGSVLKLIAMITMFIDHTAVFVLSSVKACTVPFLTVLGKEISVFWICRAIGRIAFPIYCFLLVQGFIHTKSRLNYGIRLFAFALISELAWNFAFSGSLFYQTQNVLFTLLLGYLALCALEYFKNDYPKQLIAVLLLFLVCTYGRVDYGMRGFGLILVFYLVNASPVLQAALGSCMLGNIYSLFAFVPISLYNGERGFIRGKLSKYAMYLFYPLHLLLLGIARCYM